MPITLLDVSPPTFWMKYGGTLTIVAAVLLAAGLAVLAVVLVKRAKRNRK